MSLLVLLLRTVAFPAYAGRPYEPILVDPATVCPAAPQTPGMIQVMGRASGWGKLAAMDAAREDGVEQMVSMHAAGFGATAREAVRRNTFEVVGAGTFQRQVACVPMALPRDYVDHLERAGRDLDDQVRTLAAALAREARGRVVDVRPATRGESGAVSQVSDSIRSLLLGYLGPTDGVRFLEDGRWVPNSVPLTIKLTANKVEVIGTVRLDGVPLGGLRFPLDLFSLTPGETNAADTAASVSVGGEDRRGANGLSVYIAPPDPDGIACEGEVVELVVNTDRPARVRLYSVSADGTTYLMWPPDPRYAGGVPAGTGPTGDQMVSELRLPGTTMIPSADGRDERMVLVAVPPGGSFGAAENWRGFCEVSGGFSEAALLPPGAAVSSVSFLVRPSEATGCVLTEAVESARVSNAVAIVGQAPPCR